MQRSAYGGAVTKALYRIDVETEESAPAQLPVFESLPVTWQDGTQTVTRRDHFPLAEAIAVLENLVRRPNVTTIQLKRVHVQ